MKKQSLVLMVLSAMGLGAVSSQAATSGQWDVGGQIGYASQTPGGFNAQSGLGFGAVVEYMPMVDWRFGANWLYTSKTVVSPLSIATMTILATADYMIPGAMGFYVGPRVGYGSVKADISSAISSTTGGFAFGGQAGYDYSFSPEFSIGAQFNYTDILTSGSSSSLLAVVAPIKFHF